MPDANQSRTTVASNGTVTVRQRPSLMLMMLRLGAAEQTLELGLAKLKKQSESSSQWLKRLGATHIEFGEPHFDDQANNDRMTRATMMRAKILKKSPTGASSDRNERGVNVVLTAIWEIASKSSDEVLILIDRLRFEATEDVAVETPAETPSWTTPEDQVREMMANIAQMQQPPEIDRDPQFLFIARLNADQIETAAAEAFRLAQAQAEQLARSAGLVPGRLRLQHIGANNRSHVRTDQMMKQQHCIAMLAGSSFAPGENDAVSDSLQAAEFVVTVSLNYSVEAEDEGPETTGANASE